MREGWGDNWLQRDGRWKGSEGRRKGGGDVRRYLI
jgi:hypothetical protein